METSLFFNLFPQLYKNLSCGVERLDSEISVIVNVLYLKC